jgi:hypothetical protein
MPNNSQNLLLDLLNDYVFDLDLIHDVDNLDFDKGSLSDEGLITDGLTFYYDFSGYSDIYNTYSVFNYVGAVSSGFTISDIGLGGIDNGFVSNITGETITFSSGSTIHIKPVTGLTYNYPLSILNDTNIGKRYLNLSGGFYQGFYKLDDYPYNVLPNRTEAGFTLNFWINPVENSVASNTLNDLYPDNKGYFFFMGTRAENKFHNIILNESGKTTTENTLLSPVTGDTSLISTGLTYDTGTTVNDVNGIGFYFRDNKLGYKSIIVRKDLSGNTLTNIHVEESPVIFTGTTGSTWLNISIVFKREERLKADSDGNFPCPLYFEECTELSEIPASQKGKLTFLVNARPVFSTEVEEPIFRALETHRSKQQGVSYNISIGGGTQGLIESKTFDGTDPQDENLLMETEFAGSFIGGISIASMYDRPLTIPEIIRNFYGFKDIYKRPENFGGAKIIVNSNLIK